MFQHRSASSFLRRTRTAVTAAVLVIATVGPVVGLAGPAQAATTFSNGTALTIADAVPPCTSGCTPGVASSYPSNIAVSGLSGTLSNLTLTLTGVTHAFTGDLGVLLVGPAGQKFIVASDSGNNGGSSGATITFDDAAAGVPSESAGWGNGSQTYKPFNYSDDPDSWPSPAPAGPYSNADNGASGSGSLSTTSFASVFNGTNPNGTWSLYVVDDAQGDTGSISGGWSLSLTTAAAAATTTTVTSSVNPSLTGGAVTFTAHVVQSSDLSNATSGTVAFTDGATVLASGVAVSGSGTASFSTSALAEGTHTITATYTGNATYGNSSGSVTQVVDHPTTQTGGAYCNSGSITINDASIAADGTATPYPSHINLTGASGGLTNLQVELKGVSASFADDLDVELVGPAGQSFMLASDAGGANAISGVDVTFDDNAGSVFSQSSGGWGSGTDTSRPVDYNTGTDAMPAPAAAGWSSPAPTGAATLTSVFGGSNPNGTWSLYVADDAIDGHTGSISSGWCLNTVTSSDPATTTTVTSSVNPTTLGGSTTFSAHVVLAADSSDVTAGSVTFRDGSTVVSGPTALNASGVATFTTSALTEGTHTITATYGGVGGSFNLSSATVTQTVNGVTTVTANTFCNNGGVTINDPPGSGVGTASPYASHLVVSGITGNLLSLTATLKGVTHGAPDDLDVLLVGPGGQALKLVSDAGGLVGISNVNATFSDAAGSLLPDSSSWGSGSITVKPTDYNDGVDTFPAPAPGTLGSPAPAGSATLDGTFAGTSPNGTWSLYVVDDSLGQVGSMSGWCLTLSIPAAATNDTYTAAKDTTLTVAAPGVLANDSGYPAPTVSAFDATSTQGGTVSVGTDGHFSYTPPAGFTGDDTFTYTASNGGSSVGTVTVHVTNVPVVSGATLTRQQGSAASASTVATVSDVETAAGSLVVGAGTSTGITLSGLANLAGTVAATVGATCTATTGAHTLSVTATDTDGFTGTGTLTVNVTANTAPTLSYASLAANEGAGTTGTPLTGPGDNGSVASLSILSVSSGFTGTVTVDGPASGTPGVLHVSNAGPAGSYTVTVRATDNCGATTDVPVTLSVNGAPTVDAGADDSDTIFIGPYTLNGSASDDGVAPGGALVTTWSKVSGPGSVTFGDLHAVSTTATFGTGGVYVLQLSATDGQLTSTDTVQITANDQPTINVPADITVAESSPGAGAVVPFTVTAGGYPASTITCTDGATTVHSGDTFAAGTHTIICVADNGFGTAGGTFTITVTAGPVITVPADITVDESSPGAGKAVSFAVTATGTPTPTISCLDGTTAVSSGDVFTVGSHTISCTATNSTGSDTKSFLIVVRSVPVITVPADFSVLESPAGSGSAAVTWTTSATGFPTPTIACLEGAATVHSGDTFSTGSHTIACTATNAAGSDSGSFVVTVKAGPVVSVPADITVTEASAGAGKAVTFAVTATGVPAPSIVCKDGAVTVHSGDTFAAGVHAVSCTATNSVGSDSKSFTITVQSLPVLTVPANFSVAESPLGSGSAPVSYTTSATGTPAPVTVCQIGTTTVTSPTTLTVGSHQIDCVATNVVGSDSQSFTVTVTPGNRAPVASAGGPYAVAEGQPLHLDASGSSDADGDALTYAWDVNGDGTFTDATGVSPTLSWSQLGSLSINDGPGTFHPQVRVSDGKAAAVTSAATTLTVSNAAPVAFVAGSASASGGLTVTLTFTATDPSPVDQVAGFSYVVHWGDGASDGPVHGGGALPRTHTYAAAGSYTVTMTATDKDGGVSASASKTITVTSLVSDICGTGKTLFVGGSAGDDVITVQPGATSTTVTVVVDGVTQTVPAGFVRLVISAGAGADSVTVTGLTSVRRIIYGGSGNDTLVGGNGPSVLVGGDGNDHLTGGSARDVLIGGAGVDVEKGGAGDDLLIDGATSWDTQNPANEEALCGIQAEWTRTDASFALRVAHLLGIRKGSLSSVHFILHGPKRNVFSGGDKDVLEGDSGLNWYLCNSHGKGVLDRLRKRSHDRVTDL